MQAWSQAAEVERKAMVGRSVAGQKAGSRDVRGGGTVVGAVDVQIDGDRSGRRIRIDGPTGDGGGPGPVDMPDGPVGRGGVGDVGETACAGLIEGGHALV